MTNLTSVSVIIPTCDRPEMLKRAVASVLEQDYPAIKEIIITDDGSEEKTREIAAELGKKDKRIIYSKNVKYKKGPAGNKQNGLDLAGGNFVTVLDDDDYLLPEALSGLMRVQAEKGYKILFSNCRRSDNGEFTGKHHGRSEEVRYEDFITGRYEGEYFGITHLEIIKKTRLLDEFAGLEALGWLNLYKTEKLVLYYLHEAARVYTVHSGQFSNFYEDNAERTFNGYKKYLELFGKDVRELNTFRYAYLNRLASYFAKLCGKRRESLDYALESLRADKTRPLSWFFLLFAWLPAGRKFIIAAKKAFSGSKRFF